MLWAWADVDNLEKKAFIVYDYFTMLDYKKNHIHEYFYRRHSELDDLELQLLSTMRTKRTLLILCDKLREIELERLILMRIYDDIRHLI